MIIRVVAILFLLIFATYEAKKFINKSKDDLSVENIKKLLEFKSGDIILRKENNALSDFFSTLDGASYSHIGVVIDTKDGLKVFHIEVDEDFDGLKISTLKEFVYFANKIAIYRHKEEIDINKLSNILNDLIKKDIKFDYNFDLNNDRFYCTELINDIYLKLFDENLYIELYNFQGKDGISINNIIKNPKLEKSLELDFKF